MFPSIKADQWNIEKIHKLYRFQLKGYLDCGFHLLNFVLAAINDTEIHYNRIDFNAFKEVTALKLTAPITTVNVFDVTPKK